MKSFPELIDEARRVAGDPLMTDNAIALRIGSNAVAVHRALRHAYVCDSLAIRLARFLGLSVGELVTRARAEREHDPVLRGYLQEWTDQVLRGREPA